MLDVMCVLSTLGNFLSFSPIFISDHAERNAYKIANYSSDSINERKCVLEVAARMLKELLPLILITATHDKGEFHQVYSQCRCLVSLLHLQTEPHGNAVVSYQN